MPAETVGITSQGGFTIWEEWRTKSLAAVTETVTVTGDSPKPAQLSVPTISQAYSKAEVDALPVGRTPNQIADLAPGVTSNTSNVGQLAISGATSFDNVFMMNGVDINDNLFGTAHNLFIEDAIQETNILTGGISAEWGRFSGGVVNMITKSGGNTFTGSFRENFANPTWIDETPRPAHSETSCTCARVTSAGETQPVRRRVLSNSLRRISRMRRAPASPSTASPHTSGRPIITARAPSASAASTWVPRLMPPST